LQPRHATERFRQVNPWRCLTHIVAIDHADRGGRIQFRDGLRRGADDHGLLVRAYRLKGRQDNRNQQQRESCLTGGDDFHEVNQLR